MDIATSSDSYSKKSHFRSKHKFRHSKDGNAGRSPSHRNYQAPSHGGSASSSAYHGSDTTPKSCRRRSRQGHKDITHLMEFQYSNKHPLQLLAHHDEGRGRTPRSRRHSTPQFSRDTFVHANYRFASNTTLNAASVGGVVDWSSVDLVVCPVEENKDAESNCPICLDAPVAARVSRCGHIACLPCLLRYFDTGNHKCPLCFEKISLADLRSMVFEKTASASVHQEIEMTLVGRSKQAPFTVMPCDPVKDKQIFEKVFYLPSIDDIIAREQSELDTALHECDCDVTRQFLEAAKEHNRVRFETRRRRDYEEGTQVCGGEDGAVVSPNDASSTPAADDADENEITTPDAMTFFYQASDGRNLFMHSINFRCLVSMYGEPQNFPHNIKAKILEMNEFQQTEDTRRRFRFLRHLPIASTFFICELDLTEVLSPEVLAKYHEEISDRAQKREKIQLDKERLRRRLEKQQKQYVASSPIPMCSLRQSRRHELAPLTSMESYPSLSPPKEDVIPKQVTSFSVPVLKQPDHAWSNVFSNAMDHAKPMFEPRRLEDWNVNSIHDHEHYDDDDDDDDDDDLERMPPPLSLSPKDWDFVSVLNSRARSCSAESNEISSNKQRRRFKKLFSNASTRGCR